MRTDSQNHDGEIIRAGFKYVLSNTNTPYGLLSNTNVQTQILSNTNMKIQIQICAPDKHFIVINGKSK